MFQPWNILGICTNMIQAVNALEGRIFNGNAIQARFFEREKFEDGVYVD